MIDTENLIECKHCGGNVCFEQQVSPEIKTLMCMGCGFLTNSLMKEGQEFLEEQKSILPNIYVDLMEEDKDGNIWMPSTFNKPDQGMVFVNGTNVKEWKWRAIKATEVKEEEKEKFPIPHQPGKYYSHKMDMENYKDFEPEDFIDALDFVGVFENILEEGK